MVMYSELPETGYADEVKATVPGISTSPSHKRGVAGGRLKIQRNGTINQHFFTQNHTIYTSLSAFLPHLYLKHVHHWKKCNTS